MNYYAIYSALLTVDVRKRIIMKTNPKVVSLQVLFNED